MDVRYVVHTEEREMEMECSFEFSSKNELFEV